jgi:hypothetical protein
MERITLYSFVNDEIKISIEAYFEGDSLIIDGYDIGRRVEEYWGDSDYEYVLTIPPAGVDFLYAHLEIERGNRDGLLTALAGKYNTNSCYSDIYQLMEDKDIKCSGFTWT